MISIDGITYDIDIISVVMSADALDKFAERDNSGTLHRELIGTFLNYNITFASGYKNPVVYAQLWRKLTENIEFHTVTLWDEAGEYTQVGYFAETQHSISKLKDGVPYWKSLSTSFVAKQPRA
jgi:hypothetical protein